MSIVFDNPNGSLNNMATSLLNWLDGSTQGALIVYPRTLHRCNVVAVITAEWTHIAVTKVSEEPDASQYSYSNLDEINRALQNSGIVLFDDARMLAIISPALIPTPRAKIIVLTTWGDTLRQLNTVIEKFPGLHLLSLDIINDKVPIQWRTTRVPLSARQIYYYDIVRAREVAAPVSNRIIPYPTTRMLTLYTYPDIVMQNTLTGAQICQHTDVVTPILSDSDKRSLSETTLRPLLEKNGPKLLSVLDGVVSNWPAKQIVVTRFNQHYGVYLINEFLHLLSEFRQNPYENNEIFCLSCTDPYEVMVETLTEFNNTPSAVLITNVVPILPLDDVSVIHVADSYSFLTLQGILTKLHKPSELTIYSHLAQHPQEPSADEVLYHNLEGYVQEANRIYSGLRTQAAKIIFHPTYGLMVSS